MVFIDKLASDIEQAMISVAIEKEDPSLWAESENWRSVMQLLNDLSCPESEKIAFIYRSTKILAQRDSLWQEAFIVAERMCK